MISLVLLLTAYSVNGQLLGTGVIDTGGSFGSIFPQLSPPAPFCPDDYAAIQGHTLCLARDARAMEMGVTQMDINLILSEHNKFRASTRVTDGTTIYVSSDLAKLTWDDNLAKVAQAWANQCQNEHDEARNRSIPEYGIFIGQNIHSDTFGTTSWWRVLQAWNNEGVKYRYGRKASTYLTPEDTILHFTQIVSNTTTRVGCGYSVCSNATWRNYYVCNYASGQVSYEYPFTVGNRCGACPGNCVNSLCANGCEGKLCRNGGTLDFKTCTCKCMDLYSGPECERRCEGKQCRNGGTVDFNTCKCKCIDLYTGPECEALNCPTRDNSLCGVLWDASFCSQGEYFNNTCPYMCGVCTGNYGTFVSGTTPSCIYVGVRQSPETCLTMGDNGYDGVDCATKGGQYNCSYCSYSSIQASCPIMCGVCEEPNPVYSSTQGCQYRGQRPPLETCSQYGANGKDYSLCTYIGCEPCSTDPIVKKSFCPQTCGLCP